MLLEKVRFDYTMLRKRMKRRHVTLKWLSDSLGCTDSHLCRKLHGAFGFNQQEILGICTLLEIPAEQISLYFFTRVQEGKAGVAR